MRHRFRGLASVLGGALFGGAGLGFIARDLAGLGQPGVALAWIAGALAGARRSHCVSDSPRHDGANRSHDHLSAERGQATIEWVALVLLAALALGALAAAGPRIDGRPFGGFLAHRILCAIKGGCRDGDRALARAYGERDAALARRLAPNLVYEPGERSLPVDWRRCRSRACSDAPDDRDLDAHRSHTGHPATAFVRRVRRGGRTYFLYWLYYPDSNTVLGPSDRVWDHSPLRLFGRYPGFHEDDWEGYAVRIDGDGRVWVRSTSHGHWQGCKRSRCRNRWTGWTGWTRVSRGSHAGHIPLEEVIEAVRPHTQYGGPSPTRRRDVPQYPGIHLRERTTTSEGLRLIPLEPLTRGRRRYRRLDPDVSPPWEKPPWRDPEDDSS